MMAAFKQFGGVVVLSVSVLLLLAAECFAQNQVMGAVRIVAATKAERSSGVWIDGQYVGYVSELKGRNQVTLLPGPHDIVVRQSGYTDFDQTITVQAGATAEVYVSMKRDPRVQYSKITAEIKLDVTPKEAGVFLDGAFVGNIHEFGGVGRAMLVNPGKHELKLVLPGYQDFVTEVDLLPRQKFTIATKLIPGTSSTQPGAPPKQESRP
jgi:PEGA domain